MEKCKIPASPDETVAGPGTRTLLIVDDEPSILAALRRALRRANYAVLTAQDGRTGLDLMARHRVEVVVSDGLMLPLPGYEFLKVVRHRYPQCVRIMLSGYSNPQTTAEAIRSCELFRFLEKPWNDDELVQTIDAAFQYWEQNRATGFPIGDLLES